MFQQQNAKNIYLGHIFLLEKNWQCVVRTAMAPDIFVWSGIPTVGLIRSKLRNYLPSKTDTLWFRNGCKVSPCLGITFT